jgi:hypothetical protein
MPGKKPGNNAFVEYLRTMAKMLRDIAFRNRE